MMTYEVKLNNPNCYYKQLKRIENQYNAVVEQNKSLQQQLQAEKEKVRELEGRNEKLKIQLIQKDEVNTFFNTPVEGWSNDPCGICRYKQILDEIKELAKETVRCKTLGCNCKNSEKCLSNTLEQILQECEVMNDV